MRQMETLQALIEEAKVRTVCWAICAFAISYFLSHTSKSMWTNLPISFLILSAFRYLSYEVELRRRVRPICRQTYLSYLEKKQLPVNDSHLATVPTTLRWRRKIDSPPVEAAIDDFVNKILHDFVIDLWYSFITPDKEAPELIRILILDALEEIAGRIKEINLVELLTRDMVDLIGDHLDLYRRNQSDIGVDVMGALSFEERDERLKRHLIASKELHPALISPESEHKVLQRIVGGILAIVLRPQEAQCPLVRCISRELLTCLVVQPVMNFASPGYINELIEYIFLTSKDNKSGVGDIDRSTNTATDGHAHSISVGNTNTREPESWRNTCFNQSSELALANNGTKISLGSSEHVHPNTLQEDPARYIQPRAADWAMILEAATKRRTQVLAPENLENMWTKGRNYEKKSANRIKAGTSCGSARTTSGIVNSTTVHTGTTRKELSANVNQSITCIDDNYMTHLMLGSNNNNRSIVKTNNEPYISQDLTREQAVGGGQFGDWCEENARKPSKTNNDQLKRFSSTPDIDIVYREKSGKGTASREYCIPSVSKHKELTAELISHNEGSLCVPKIKCRVVGAYFEKLGSKSFAVYSIAVTDAEKKTWFVKRRYRNFERLHRHLKDIPNYPLQLPPKRFLSSSLDDYFVHQRCILLDKYLQDLLSIANVAEQHEVWDFLSVSSKNYSFGKSTSVMKTLAVNVDDAMDDIVRQFKGASDGLRRKVVDSSPSNVISLPIAERSMALSGNEEEMSKHSRSHNYMGTARNLSDEEAHVDDHSSGQTNGWHSDNEFNSKGLPPHIFKCVEESTSLDFQRTQRSAKFDRIGLDKFLASESTGASELLGDLVRVPPEWTPPNVSVPLLNLVDKIFQLNRRGWLRRQVFWISKQILQLMMEDAIDDWILRQIHWLRKDEVIAQGIRWVQDVLWPNGTFFIKLDSSQGSDIHFSHKSASDTSQTSSDKVGKPSSFELQLEAARRASDVRKMIIGGAPSALVSLIGRSQYRRCAKDIYYFLQSTVCVKQLAYGMLELSLISVFPELRDLVRDIHDKAHVQSP